MPLERLKQNNLSQRQPMKNKSNTKVEVTIGISAYNEAANIGHIIKDILSQRQINFTLNKIIIISDGSTDKTVDQVKLIQDYRIQVVAGNKNLGQTARINQLMCLSMTNILIFLDSDIILDDQSALTKLINPFYLNPKVALVGGNPNSVGKYNFLTQSWLVTKNAYTYIRQHINNGNNVFGCMGGMLAIAKPLYRQLSIPRNIFAWDSFLYFSCLKHGYKFVNAKNAQSLHPLIYTLSAHINRSRRHNKSTFELKPYFGNLIDKEFYIPRRLFLEATLKQFLKYPIHTIFIYSLNIYSRLLTKYDVKTK